MISVEEALARVIALATRLGSEQVPLSQAAGRVLALPVSARINQPPFNASAMDGYAIVEADHRPGATLAVIGEAGAGHGFAGTVHSGQAVRIFTGAPVPQGAERVVLQEDVRRDTDFITLGDRLEGGANIRPLGQDFRIGDQLSAPRRLRPADLGLVASMNVDRISVIRRPVVSVLSTGDELVLPGAQPGPDQIIASNGIALAAFAETLGAEVRLLPIARDTEESLLSAFAAAAGSDVVVTIGGASVGDHDLVGKVAAGLGLDRAFWKVAMRPGKPIMAGRLGDSILIGLPGNPVSAMVCAYLFLEPLLAVLQGLPGTHRVRYAALALAVAANGNRRHYMRARLSTAENGADRITPFDRQDSALFSVLSEADALLIRPENDPGRTAGERVAYLAI